MTKKDTKTLIMLSVIVLMMIGGYQLIKRTVKEQKVFDSNSAKEDTSGIEEIAIKEPAKEPKAEITEKTIPAEDFIKERQTKEEFAKETTVELPVKDETLIERRPNGIETEIVKPEKVIAEIPVLEEAKKELRERTTMSKEEQITSVDIQSKAIHIEKKKEIYTSARKHTVEPGDTLYSLAREYYNNPVMWEKIYNANEDTIDNKNLLETGQILIIPE